MYKCTYTRITTYSTVRALSSPFSLHILRNVNTTLTAHCSAVCTGLSANDNKLHQSPLTKTTLVNATRSAVGDVNVGLIQHSVSGMLITLIIIIIIVTKIFFYNNIKIFIESMLTTDVWAYDIKLYQ